MIRYDKKFMNEINKVVRNYNAKINRLSKTNKILPQKFTSESLRNLKATSRNRTDIRRALKDLQSFTARGGEKTISIGNNTMPRYQFNNVKRYRRLATYRINQKIKRYETTHPVSNGKTDKFTFSQRGEDEYLTLLAKKEKLLDVDISSLGKKELDLYLHKLKVNIREYDLDEWQRNYIDIFQDTALSYGYDPYKLETIVMALQSLNPDEFDELAFENRNIKAVLTHYKSLLDIKTAEDLDKNSSTVIDNLDSIYEHLDIIFGKKKNG